MAGIEWESPYRQQSQRGRFTDHTLDVPIGVWATDQLSIWYERVRDHMEERQPEARDKVMTRSRVDTGYMRSNADSFFSATDKEIVLEFGWDEGRPFYAPFQEFGTDNGIEPMLAVYQTWVEEFNLLKFVVSR